MFGDSRNQRGFFMCLTPVIRNYCFFGFFPLTPLIVATAPRFLPYILRCNTPQCCGTRQGRSVIHVFLYSSMCFLYNNIKHSHLLPLYCCVTRQRESVRFDFVTVAVFFNPSVLADTSPIFCCAKHPVMLRGTAGRRGRSIEC